VSKINNQLMEADYYLGGSWGDKIQLLEPEKMSSLDLNNDTVPVVGWKSPRPSVGQTLCGEFEKSWIKFEFVNVRLCADPQDMFFADVKACAQVMKRGSLLAAAGDGGA
jgi:hypothetical protein